MAIRSSVLAVLGHSLTIQTWPSRSMICALISPTFSCSRSFQSFVPLMIASRASFTHSGHSESVCRGQPSVGLVFSQDFSSGFSVHFGVNDGLGLNLLKNWMVSKATPAVLQITVSNVFHAFDPTPAVLGISACLAFFFRLRNCAKISQAFSAHKKIVCDYDPDPKFSVQPALKTAPAENTQPAGTYQSPVSGKSFPCQSLPAASAQRPAGYAQRGESGVEWRLTAANGTPVSLQTAPKRTADESVPLTISRCGLRTCRKIPRQPALLGHHRPQHRDREVSQFRRAFVQLDPSHRAVVLHVLRYFRLVDSQVLGQARLQLGAALAPPTAAQQVARRQCAASGRLPRSSGSPGPNRRAAARRDRPEPVRIVQRSQRASQHSPQLRFQLRDLRRQPRIACA